METINEQQSMNQAEMPRYRCHKEVHALKIASVERHSPIEPEGCASAGCASAGCETATITPADPGYARFEVDANFVRKHNPQAGGYFVVYKDGYQSFSSAEAFEDGYTRIEA